MELAFSITLIAAMTVVGLILLRSAPATRSVRLLFVGGMVTASAWLVFATENLHNPPIPESEVIQRPIEVPTDGYATSDRCSACHPGQYAAWRNSFHSSMTQIASPETVMGDFSDRLLQLGNHSFRLSRRGDEYWVDMPDIDSGLGTGRGLRIQRRILMTTGSHHMQAYWYGTDNTRVMGILPFVYNVEFGDWLPRNASFIIPPLDQPVSELGRWNKVCLECHATLGRLRPAETAEMKGDDTHVAEFGITCEACHGPGEKHIESNTNAFARYAAHFSDEPVDHIVQPEHLTKERSAEICGQCHSTSVWTSQESIDSFMEVGFAYRPGDVLSDSKAIVRGKLDWNPPEIQAALRHQPEMIPNTFWSDGMNRITGREYNGLIQTPCYERGEMTCLSCHEMHKASADPRGVKEWANDQLKPMMRGNDACTQCHSIYADSSVVESHTHHAAGSTGSICYNCHMPYTSYGLLSAVRSHQVDSPSVRGGSATGRPVACNQCHIDKPLAWTAERLEAWYGIPTSPLPPEDELLAAIPLMALRGDAGQRALAAWSMSWQPATEISGNDWEGLYLSILLTDPYPAVRYISSRSLVALPGFSEFDYSPMMSENDLQEKGNEALRLWAIQHVNSGRRAKREVLIGNNGPDMSVLLEVLSKRNDRSITFAE